MAQNWKTYKLSEVFEIIGGGTPKTTIAEYWNGSIPWLSVVDFNNDLRSVSETEKTITESGLKNSSTKLLKKGQLIISARGTVGQIAQLKRDMTFNQSCYGLNGFENLLINDYGYYLLKYSVSNIQANTHGSVFDTITKSTFENIEVQLPSLPEQKAIAQILSDIDDKIENNLAINKTLEEMAMALYKHWFVDFGTFQDGEFVDSELGEIPKGWEVKKIGDLYETSSGGTPSRKKMEYYENGEIPWIKSKELNNTFITNTEENINPLGLHKSSAKLFPAKSVLIAMYGATVGEVGINSTEATCNQAICVLKFVDLPYFYVFLYLKVEKLMILNQAVGSAQQNISQVLIKNFPLIKPNLNDVEDVFTKLRGIFNKIEHNIIENQTLTQLRDTLLPKLMSGEVRLKEFEPVNA